MDTLTLFGIAIALALDAFAVALGAGLTLEKLTGRHLFRLGWHFGLFQALMPIIGWLAGTTLQSTLAAYDHWLAFGLLTLVGGKMIREALQHEDERSRKDPTKGLTMVMLSIATSLDALAVGFTLAMLRVSIWYPALIIGLTAGLMTLVGMLLGRRIGDRWGAPVEICGGVVLILIGVKILCEHLV